MSKAIKLLTPKNKKAFNTLAPHPVQSWEWGDFRINNGNAVVRIGVYKYKKLIEGHQLTIHIIPGTKYKLAMLLKGSLPSKESLQFIREFCQKEKIIFVRMEPNVTVKNEKEKQKTVEYLRENGCVPGRGFFTKETFLLDLTKTEDELLKSFHPKTRYNIKVAQKHGVRVSECHSNKDFQTYLRLTGETSKRQGFFAHTRKYHEKMWNFLHPSIAHLLSARYKEETLVSWILFVWHDTLYYPYGASTQKYKNVMAANLMMWEAIRFGKSLKLSKFDLWGKEDGKGFTKFKEGYNPTVVEFVGTWDLVVNKSLYPIYRTAENLRWTYLKLPLPLPKHRFN